MITQLVVKTSPSGKTSTLYLRTPTKDYKVLRMWESFSGWYWYATEICEKQDSILSDGTIYPNDQIYFGFVQGLEDEWGYFSESQLKSKSIWKVPKANFTFAGRGQHIHEP